VERPIRQAQSPELAEGLDLKALSDGTIKQARWDNALHLRSARYCITGKVHWHNNYQPPATLNFEQGTLNVDQ
jgi:hypothetical protein